MLKLFSGIASRVVRLVPRPAPAPRWSQVPGRWPPHSALRAVAGACRCYDCHIARESRKAPERAERAVRRCRERMEELRERAARDGVLEDRSPVPTDWEATWDGLRDEGPGDQPE